MRIAYDHQIFSLQPYGGISRYFAELAAALARTKHDVQIIAPAHLNRHLQQSEARRLVRGAYLGLQFREKAGFFKNLNGLLSPIAWIGVRADIVHETYYSQRAHGKGRRRVITVYDMIHELFPEQFDARDKTVEIKGRAIRRADHIICISENTRRDLERVLGIPRSRTTVIHLSPPPLTSLAPSPRYARRYLLYVGPREGYKNFSTLVRAFGASSTLREACEIVAFGGGPLREAEHALLRMCGVESKVRHVRGDDAVLARHYHDAVALVYPSLYEGFGIPPLEAMGYGCPVVCSNASSLPEVVGDAAFMFEPTSVEALQTALERVVCDPELRDELRAQGKQRVREFSWTRCAKETAAVYERTLG